MKTPSVQIQSLPRACNEALILAALAGEPRHGYQIVLDLEARSGGAFRFKHGTLYPILHRLEKEERIEGAWDDDGPRGKRKAYRLTSAGEEHLASLRGELENLFGRLFEALTPREGSGEEQQ